MTKDIYGLDSLIKKQMKSYDVKLVQELIRNLDSKVMSGGVQNARPILELNTEPQGSVKNAR